MSINKFLSNDVRPGCRGSRRFGGRYPRGRTGWGGADALGRGIHSDQQLDWRPGSGHLPRRQRRRRAPPHLLGHRQSRVRGNRWLRPAKIGDETINETANTDLLLANARLMLALSPVTNKVGFFIAGGPALLARGSNPFDDDREQHRFRWHARPRLPLRRWREQPGGLPHRSRGLPLQRRLRRRRRLPERPRGVVGRLDRARRQGQQRLSQADLYGLEGRAAGHFPGGTPLGTCPALSLGCDPLLCRVCALPSGRR